MLNLNEPLVDLFSRSHLMILNFANIPVDINDFENIQKYFERLESQGNNPRLPDNRQLFNNQMLDQTKARYLVSQYGEDRLSMLKDSSIAAEGRTIHLGIDIFSKDLEQVFSPCDGEIIRAGREGEAHSFGNYAILKPSDHKLPYFFFGHLSFNLPKTGQIKRDQPIAKIGDYVDNENGGWSRHLHLQCLAELPPLGQAPIGYGSADSLDQLYKSYPNPMQYFPNWIVSK